MSTAKNLMILKHGFSKEARLNPVLFLSLFARLFRARKRKDRVHAQRSKTIKIYPVTVCTDLATLCTYKQGSERERDR